MEPTWKVIISGDRSWSGPTIEEKIECLLLQMPKRNGQWNVSVIHGACHGVDQSADKIAKKLGFQTLAFPADWKRYGKAAGPIRNGQMLDMDNVYAVYAFHRDIGSSKGTKNILDQASKKGIPFYLFD